MVSRAEDDFGEDALDGIFTAARIRTKPTTS
jgi:hypothetical protein